MRYVLKNTDEVFHYWANQVQSEGRAASVSFHGTRLYSYAAQIAEIIKYDGHTYAVHTDRRWSMTTSHHQSAARSASRHHRCISILTFGLSENELYLHTLQEVNRTLEKIDRMRSQEKKAYARNMLWGVINSFNTYAQIMGWTSRIQGEGFDQIRQQAEEAEAYVERREQERLQRMQAANAENIEKWLKGEVDHCGMTVKPLLRIHGDMVQTSHGAEIPVQHARRLWPVIQRVRDSGNDLATEIRLGVYTLTCIAASGAITVGCHHIEYDQILRMAELLGLTEAAAV